MQSIVLSRAPSFGDLSQHAEFSFPDLPDDFVESFFSSPSVDCNELEDLDLTASFCSFSELLEHEPSCFLPDHGPSSPSSSSVATEPLVCDNDLIYQQMIADLIDQEERKPRMQRPRKRPADEDFEYQSACSPHRRKSHHIQLHVDEEEDSQSSSSFSHKSLGFSSGDSCSGKSSQRKRLSNREAAHRYRQKMKMRAENMNHELSESFRSMNRAKQAYEKAAEALRVLQRVVKDLTVS